jgi:hypothetical protein
LKRELHIQRDAPGDAASSGCVVIPFSNEEEMNAIVERQKGNDDPAALRSIAEGTDRGLELFAERMAGRGRPTWHAVNVLQDTMAATRGTARAALSRINLLQASEGEARP